jgi:6-pyruvoyltetrahydropterin/6-carboxytetrahydropterin synthase
MFEVSKQFRFEAAHTLLRVVETESSLRIHGHSYRAEVTLRGESDNQSGMVLDFTLFERALEDARSRLDHHFLDEINDLGPATMENLSRWIWKRVQSSLPGLACVTVYRDSTGDKCAYFGPAK